jgi:hypothetical protein
MVGSFNAKLSQVTKHVKFKASLIINVKTRKYAVTHDWLS